MIYGIKIDREDFNFSAAQILVMNGELEALSGHNYSVAVDISGELDGEGAIIDFRTLKQWMREIVSTYNHKTLVPTQKEGLNVRVEADQVSITYDLQTITCPKAHCLLLPLVNTTCEELAREIALEIQRKLVGQKRKYTQLTVTLSESPGQGAYVRLTP